MTQTLASIAPAGNALPDATLQTFTLDDLAQYTREGVFGPTASRDFRVFYVGRDDVHGVLVHLFSRARLSVKMNMFGYDDDELNQILIDLAEDPTVMVQVTLDKSQASGVHEKKILASDTAADPAAYAADFAVGQSDTHQISHTKGGVLDGIVAFEGSTNWSTSGEGSGITLNQTRQKRGFKAQNNTLTVYVNAYEIAKFAARLDYEHAVAAGQPQPVVSAS
jgi:PLD-like domain